MTQRLAYVLLALAACGGRSSGPADPGEGTSGDASGSESGDASGSESGDLRDAADGSRHCAFRGFAPALAYNTTAEPMTIAVIDRTHNGHADLLVGERGA